MKAYNRTWAICKIKIGLKGINPRVICKICFKNVLKIGPTCKLNFFLRVFLY